MIRIDVPMIPEDTRSKFKKVQDEIDRSKWVGRGPNYELPGGGNDLTLNESDNKH